MKQWLLTLSVLVCPYFVMAQAFLYPVPPDSIRDRQGRITYMIKHFWNEQNISDTTNFQRPGLLLDYLYLLKQRDLPEQEKDITRFVSLACRREETFGAILFWLDQILYDSSSPHYDETLCLKLMTAVVASDAAPVMKLIPAERVKMMSQNQIGMPANDFGYTGKNGEHHRLYEVEAPLLLLVFNNPDCSLCHKAEAAVHGNILLQNMQNGGQLKVLAITPDADFADWKNHKYPSSWLVGIDKERAIYGKRLYDIQRLPCMYLLDKDKRVLLKEANYDRVCAFLEKH